MYSNSSSQLFKCLDQPTNGIIFIQFNYPLQLGPTSPTRPRDARTYEIQVQADDILILASDGMSDNLWEEDVLDEVGRFVGSGSGSSAGIEHGMGKGAMMASRRSLAAMISEALCSRARRVSERARGCKEGTVCGGFNTKTSSADSATPAPSTSVPSLSGASNDSAGAKCNGEEGTITSTRQESQTVTETEVERGREVEVEVEDEEVPFARRAREEGKRFKGGGKCDDISVLVAVISPVSKASKSASRYGDVSSSAEAKEVHVQPETAEASVQ